MSTRLPLVLVIASLALLAVLPLPVQWRINALNAEIATMAEPARHAVTQIQGALAIEAAGARGFLLTRDTQFVARHREAEAQRDSAMSRLLPIARRLGGDAAAEAAALMRDIRPADQLLDSLFAGTVSTPAYIGRLDSQQERLEAAVRTAIRLDQALRTAEVDRLGLIRATRNVGVVLSIVFVLFAGIAAVFVARLGAAAERDRRNLEAATESRARLMRGFTHDVKNPMGAADGYLALLEENVYGPLDDAKKQSVMKARRSIRTALGLIQDLLDLARAEAGQLETQCVPVDLPAVVEEVADAFRAQAVAAGLELSVDVSERVPPVESDPARVRQVLANLVSNAIKYTPRDGHVTMRVAPAHDGRGPRRGAWAVAQVRDDGRGIAREKQALVFQEFTRFDPRAAQGAGLGLAISQRIARALKGDITVESSPGAGSTFTLWLPARDGLNAP